MKNEFTGIGTEDLINCLPENMTIVKDSSLWTIFDGYTSIAMLTQDINESFRDFIIRYIKHVRYVADIEEVDCMNLELKLCLLNNKIDARFKTIANEYVDLFCEKQELDFDLWIGKLYESGKFSDYYFSLDEIRFDIDTNQEKHKILEWYDYAMEHEKHVNYDSYLRGFRFK